jgi:hypothetical protein
MASFKLTTTDRRKIKKEFGERGYRLFLWLNHMNYFDTKDALELEVTRLYLKSLNDSYKNENEI